MAYRRLLAAALQPVDILYSSSVKPVKVYLCPSSSPAAPAIACGLTVLEDRGHAAALRRRRGPLDTWRPRPVNNLCDWTTHKDDSAMERPTPGRRPGQARIGRLPHSGRRGSGRRHAFHGLLGFSNAPASLSQAGRQAAAGPRDLYFFLPIAKRPKGGNARACCLPCRPMHDLEHA